MNNEDQIKLGINSELVDFKIIEKDNSEEVEAVFVSKEQHSGADIIEAKNKELQNCKDFGVLRKFQIKVKRVYLLEHCASQQCCRFVWKDFWLACLV